MDGINIQELLAFIMYFSIVLVVGFVFYKKSVGNEKDYFIGGRKMGSFVTALSAQASDMSGWLLMGLPGSVLAAGMGEMWVAIGLFIGTVLNWVFVASRLRRFSQVADDAITVPQYLNNRFKATSKTLQIICAVVFFACFTVYVASGFKAAATLFEIIFPVSTSAALIIAGVIILLYTFFGGFAAVCWTDLIQGMLMLVALITVPIVAIVAMGGMPEIVPDENYITFLPETWNFSSVANIISGLAWGLGYCGMPHILVRFMAIEKSSMIKKSKNIAIIWVAITLSAAVIVGLIGRSYVPELMTGSTETVFIVMVRNLFPGFISGILLSAVLAASMSTADSQLLVASSALTSDVYKPMIRPKASEKELLWVGRIVVIIVAVIGFFIAANPNSGSIMDLVSNAWAGFGAAFGPVIVLSLYWKRFTYKGAITGIICGGVVVVLWMIFLSSSTGIYELLPGFIAGLIGCYVGSKCSKEPSRDVKDLFDKALSLDLEE